ncbi:type III secretion protein HrpB4 [Burkholderia lata]|uniref:type III secretion protein HrpB4 n=1 Tax=Burkholderia lata (strain ATCC 17760 / DSM 23089 / LMG 22485 / NCIMB 9086 / R18194 / 383) TaxID=482957 RepID=UPI0014540B38|nr:type III secretion protein HrpB4 [Burkholderia lata]VWD53082.1 type III secretion protein HrpB4 [Burkholderia lata]
MLISSCQEQNPGSGRQVIDASIERYLSALAVYQRNVRTAAVWADSSWMSTAIGDVDVLGLSSLRAAASMLDERRIAAVSHALLDALDFEPPKLSALVGPQWSSLDAMPVEVGARVLRMRALIFRRMEVRRLIDRKSRVALSEWAGMPIESLVREHSGAPDIALLARTLHVPPLHSLDAHALSCEGLALLLRDLCVDRPPFALLRLLFSRDIELPEWPRRVDRALDAQGSARVMAELPEWVREWGWVFG